MLLDEWTDGWIGYWMGDSHRLLCSPELGLKPPELMKVYSISLHIAPWEFLLHKTEGNMKE